MDWKIWSVMVDYMKSNHAERYRHHIRMGTLSARAFELNEEAYECWKES